VAATAHFWLLCVVCCVLCVVCCVLCVVVVTSSFSYLTGRNVKIWPAKMANLYALITIDASLDAPNVIIVLGLWTCLDIWAET
jgi:hypothetical protein